MTRRRWLSGRPDGWRDGRPAQSVLLIGSHVARLRCSHVPIGVQIRRLLHRGGHPLVIGSLTFVCGGRLPMRSGTLLRLQLIHESRVRSSVQGRYEREGQFDVSLTGANQDNQPRGPDRGGGLIGSPLQRTKLRRQRSRATVRAKP